MASIINYEVYVYESGIWDLLARYPSEKRSDAIEYAKSVEFSQNKPTKVIRETYDLDTQKFQESLVYLSEYTKVSSLQKPKPMVKFPPLNIKQPKKEVSIIEAFGRLFLVISVSLAGSALMATIFLKGMAEIGFTASDLSSHFVFVLFVLFFLLLSIPMSLRWVPWDILSGGNQSYSIESGSVYGSDISDIKMAHPSEGKPMTKEASRKVSSWLFRLWDRITGTAPPPSEDPPAIPPPEEPQAEEPAEAPVEEEAVVDESETEEENFKPPELASIDQEELEEEAFFEDSLPKEEKTVIPKELEKEHIALTAFLASVLRVLQQKNVQLDTYARFGIALFVSGACEQLSKRHSLSEKENKILICSLLEVMGTSKVLSELFYDKLGEYSLEPKYLPILQGGNKAMDVFTTNPNASELSNIIRQTMNKWLATDEDSIHPSGIITVMFTDMVGSTHFTQTVGDKLAQQLIRKHNAIVRQALSTCNGREIKLTGDGTMASFSSASNAVDAAIAIQRAVAKYNRQSPTVPLEVRIGLNAGEPIVEENDLFGTTVQIASRICSLASKDQIYVSNVVKELSAGKPYKFENLGDHSLKGITQPQTIFEVLWRSEQDNVDSAKNNKKTPAPEKQENKESFESLLPEL